MESTSNYDIIRHLHGLDLVKLMLGKRDQMEALAEEAAGSQLHKGTRVFVEGRYSTRSYEAQDGSRRYVTEVVANLIARPLDTRQDTQHADFSQFGTVEDETPKPKQEYSMDTIPF